MPTWLTIFLALGGSTLVSLIVGAIWRSSEGKIKRIKELEQKAKDDKRHKEERERQDAWEAKVVSLIQPIDQKIDLIKADLVANKNATVTSLRADMMILRDRFRDQGFATPNDKAAWNQLYNDYADMGGNHFREYVDQWRDEVNNLPTTPSPDRDRRSNR